MHNVVKTDGVLGNSEPDGAGLSRSTPMLGFCRRDGAAFTGIDRLAMLGLGPFPLLLQLFLRTETQVGFVLIDQSFGVFPVNLEAIRLAIGCVRSAQVRSFVP